MSLGVGKITDARLSQALLNFMQEGIRFAFEGDSNVEDDLLLGTRLPFLLVLSKYASWIKKNKIHREHICDYLFTKEAALRSHPDFDEVHEDDLRCIREFQAILGLSVPKRQHASQDLSQTYEDSSVGRVSRTTATPASTARSTGSRRPMSAAGSQQSRVSLQSNLSPLIESPEDRELEEEEHSPSPQKRRRLANSLPEVNESPADNEENDSFNSDF